MHAIQQQNLFFIDIETVPVRAEFSQLDEQWQTLWSEKVSRTLPDAESPESWWPQRAGIMAEFAKIVCISTGYFHQGKLRIKSFYGDDEKQILLDLVNTANHLEKSNNKWCFTGHNIKEFDIPFICRRLLINGLNVPPYLDFQNMKPWETNLVDTFQYWRFGDYKNYTSLNLLAACLQVPSPKDDMDGSMVAGVYWFEKNIDRIVTYCQKDIVTVANIIRRFQNQNLLLEKDLVYV